MASLKDMRNRIASVKATRKITKAMQMVAAAKLRRAQEAALAARPYAERMAEVMASINATMADKAGASSQFLDSATTTASGGRDPLKVYAVRPRYWQRGGEEPDK